MNSQISKIPKPWKKLKNDSAESIIQTTNTKIIMDSFMDLTNRRIETKIYTCIYTHKN